MNLIERLERSIDQTGGIVRATPPDQFDRPTPCPEWDVRALLNHLIGVLVITRDAALKGDGDTSALARDNIGADAAASYDAVAEAGLKAWKDRGVEGTVKMFVGELPVDMAFHIVASDVIVHGWDVARATGQHVDWDQELADESLQRARQMLRAEMRGDFFGPEVPAPEGADAMTQLVAFLGRRS